jgi:hypothetical protein
MKCSTSFYFYLRRKDVLPALHVRKRAKDGVDSLKSHFVVVFVRPVKVDDSGNFRFEQVGDFLTEAMFSSDKSVAFPDADTRGFMAGFQQAQDNTVADDAGSTGNENRGEIRVNCELQGEGDLTDTKWPHGSHMDPYRPATNITNNPNAFPHKMLRGKEPSTARTTASQDSQHTRLAPPPIRLDSV